MRMKAKTYGINFLIVSCLRLKTFNCKQVATKKFIVNVLVFIVILKVYDKVFCLTFSYLETWAYAMNQQKQHNPKLKKKIHILTPNYLLP
jgi:hypothetical protein